MRTYTCSLALLLSSGLAMAQPGGSDLPINGAQPAYQPAPVQEPPPMQPQPIQPQPPRQPPAQVLQPVGAPARASFSSTTRKQWDVWVDNQFLCATPCTLALTTVQDVALRTQEEHPVRLDVGAIPPGDSIVRAKPLSEGIYATGITFTVLSSAALATGITLTSVGWGTGRDGMRTAGLITGVAGAVGLYGSIYLMRSALPSLSVGRAQAYATTNQVGLAGSF
jgi:hypothetical protein